MSDQLPRPDYDGLIRMSGDAMWNEGYALGVQDSMLRATQIERVLTDLIAELRDQMDYYPPDVFPPFTADDPADQSRTVDRIAGVAMRDAWTRAAAMATCAEQRLREVTGG